MAKNINYLASIQKGSSRIVGESQNDWQTIRPGSLLRFQDDSVPYTISNTNEFFYIKNFRTEDGLNLKIEEDTGINLMTNDTLTITYKEYQAINISNIIEGGKDHQEGDLLVCQNGEMSVDVTTNASSLVQLRVNEVSEAGTIESVTIVHPGKYLSSQGESIFHGRGQGEVKIALIFELITERLTSEREISKISLSDGKSNIKLSYQLPIGVKEGKLSVKKQELLLNAPYTNDSKSEKICNITRDFTEHSKFPVVSPSSQSALMNLEVAYNDLVVKLDKRIFELNDEVEELKFQVKRLEKNISND